MFKLRGVSRKDGVRNIKRKFPIYKNSNAFTDSSWLKENKENDIWVRRAGYVVYVGSRKKYFKYYG